MATSTVSLWHRITTNSGWAWFFDQPAVLVIATARLALASFALLAIWLDPTQPERYPAFTYSILAVYVVHALGLGIWQTFNRRSYTWAHIVDVYLIGTLIYLTQGPTSPFFVLVTFALFAGAMQWGVQGALATGAALVLIQLLVTAVDGIAEIDRFVMRGGYLIVGAGLFASYGAYRDRVSERLAKLAAWPSEDMERADIPPINRSLSHAASAIHSERVVVIWENEDEPLVFASTWQGERAVITSLPPDTLDGAIAPEIADLPFGSERADGRVVLTSKGMRSLKREAVSKALCQRLGLQGRVASASFANSLVAGKIFFLNPMPFGQELLSLVEIVGNRIGNQLQEYYFRRKLHDAEVAKERQRLADDLHDSTLQVITAAALQLKQMDEKNVGDDIRRALADIRMQLLTQQREIRLFATQLRERQTGGAAGLNDAIVEALSKVKQIWKCDTHFSMSPASVEISPHLHREIDFIVMEASANACRHGQATSIAVSAHVEARDLLVQIRNNGAPLRGISPRSIGNRVVENGGSLTLTNLPDWVELVIRLPLP